MAKGLIVISALLLLGIQVALAQSDESATEVESLPQKCSLIRPTTSFVDPRDRPQASPDKTIGELAFALPIGIVFVLVVVIVLVVVFVVYRARYGYFCCLKPRMSYRVPESSSDHGDDPESQSEGTALPEYQSNNSEQQPAVPNSNIAPPVYQDALQDVLVSSGGPTMIEAPIDSEEETALTDDSPATLEFEAQESVPSPDEQEAELEDSSENYDDRTPLNP